MEEARETPIASLCDRKEPPFKTAARGSKLFQGEMGFLVPTALGRRLKEHSVGTLGYERFSK